MIIRRKIKRNSLIVFLTIIALSFTYTYKKLSIHVESKILNKGKVISSSADIYFNLDNGKMITHYTKPAEYFVVTNQAGEAQIYYPAKNEVVISQSILFETEKSLFYYFLTNKLSDLGLKDLGFSLSNTRIENKLLISTWKPTMSLSSKISKIELVHENQIPIYVAYYNEKYKMTKKIYYYDYYITSNFRFPQKVVEFNYLPKGDSIVNKSVYSNIKINEQANSSYFNYKIPSNAKIIN